MHVSDKGLDLIKEFEGFSAQAYKDPGSKDGLPITIGYGTTSIDGRKVQLSDKITKTKAEALLREHLKSFEDAILEALPDTPLNQNEFDAIVCLTYNIGVSAFKKSTVKRKLAAGDRLAAANAFGMWVKNDGKVLAGLVRRRAAEKALFLAPVEALEEPKDDITTPPTAITPQVSDKPLIQSKEIVSGVGLGIGSIASVIQTISIDDLIAAKETVATTKAEVQANEHMMFQTHIVQGASMLSLAIGCFIIYKRITARLEGHR